MGERLKGRKAVVTGAGRGIGRAIALDLAAEGASVVVNDIGGDQLGGEVDTHPANEVVHTIKNRGGQAVANYDSVADFGKAERLIKSCVDSFGRLDILVNCAANFWGDGPIFDVTEEGWDAVVSTHLKGTFNCCRHASSLMRDQGGGRIINTASVAWQGITLGATAYPAAKGGIVSLTRYIAREGASYGITCNAITPEARTRITASKEAQASFRQIYEAGFITQERLKEILDIPGPEFVSPFVVYLATDEAASISGRVFLCMGGKVSLWSEPEECKAIYKNWRKDGPWTVDELVDVVPVSLTMGLGRVPPYTPLEEGSH